MVAFGGQRALVREFVLSECTSTTDLVVELGAGWAWHLLSIWVHGGPATATYVAAEYTDAGRSAASRPAALDPTLDFRAVLFDYNEPALSGLPDARHAVVFTLHSVEQIPQVPPALFEAVRALADQVTCIPLRAGWLAGGRPEPGGLLAGLRKRARLQPQPADGVARRGGGRPAAARCCPYRSRRRKPAQGHECRVVARVAC